MGASSRNLNHEAVPDPEQERERTRRMAERYRCPFIDLREQHIDPELFRSIPADLMFRFNFVPLESHNNSLVVAVADPSQLLMTDDEIGATIMALQMDLRQQQEQARAAVLEKNKKAGAEFLAANSKKEGVVSLPSGLQYKILTAGQGRNPSDGDTVVCNYRGTLLSGKEFDSSYGRGPATFGVKDVIPGFREAVKLMSAGAKWQVFIPSDLAYGERGAGNTIEPDSTLIFEIELISIQATP